MIPGNDDDITAACGAEGIEKIVVHVLSFVTRNCGVEDITGDDESIDIMYVDSVYEERKEFLHFITP